VSSWTIYNPSPAGRNVGDCAVRAVSKALDTDWETAFAMLAKNAFQMADMPSSNAVIAATLRKNGFYRYAVPNTCPDCFTVGDFADEHPKGTFVVGTGNHVVTIKDGVVYDSWDSRKEIPQYYWARKDDD